MDNAHTVDHLVECRLKCLSATLPIQLQVLLDLYQPIPQGVEEVWLEVVRIVLPNQLDDDAYGLHNGGRCALGVRFHLHRACRRSVLVRL